MSSTEMEQLKKCMDHLAYVFDKLGVQEVAFKDGKIDIKHSGTPADPMLIGNFCKHVEALYRDGLITDEEELDPDFYFSE